MVFEVDLFFIISLSILIILTVFYFFLPPLLNPLDHIDSPHKPSQELLARWRTSYQHPLTMPSVFLKPNQEKVSQPNKEGSGQVKLSKLFSAFTKAMLSLKSSKGSSNKSPSESQAPMPQPGPAPVFASYLEMQQTQPQQQAGTISNPLVARLRGIAAHLSAHPGQNQWRSSQAPERQPIRLRPSEIRLDPGDWDEPQPRLRMRDLLTRTPEDQGAYSPFRD